MTRWELDDLDDAEADYFLGVLQTCRSAFAEFQGAGAYIQPRVGAEHITAELLDVSVLLFDEVILCLDGSGLDKDPEALKRAETYVDAGCVKPLILESLGSRGFHHSEADWGDPLYEAPPQLASRAINVAVLGREILPESRLPLPMLLSELGCFGMSRILRETSPESLRAAVRATEPFHEGIPRTFENLIRSLASDQMTAYAINSESGMPREILATLATSLVTRPGPTEAMDSTLMADSLTEWYRQAIDGLPRFDDPKVVLAIRDDIADESFRVTVQRLINANTATSYHRLAGDVEKSLDRLITRSRLVNSGKARVAEAGIPGLFATVGALVGGPFGAVIGGAGGASIPVFMERLRNVTPAWTTYFLR